MALSVTARGRRRWSVLLADQFRIIGHFPKFGRPSSGTSTSAAMTTTTTTMTTTTTTGTTMILDTNKGWQVWYGHIVGSWKSVNFDHLRKRGCYVTLNNGGKTWTCAAWKQRRKHLRRLENKLQLREMRLRRFLLLDFTLSTAKIIATFRIFYWIFLQEFAVRIRVEINRHHGDHWTYSSIQGE